VPGRAGAGLEADDADDHALVALVGQRDGVEPDVADELLGRVLHGGDGGFDVHGVS
jgi:hypothetical protein